MAGYTAIADISEYLVELLRRHCVPNPVQNASQIGLCLQNGEHDLSLFLMLYGIEPMDRGLFPRDTLPLCLRYILSARSRAVPEIRAGEQARLLGSGISVLAEYSVIDKNVLQNRDLSISILMDRLSLDDKSKAWNGTNDTAPAAFYSVSPILLQLKSTPSAPRVRSTS